MAPVLVDTSVFIDFFRGRETIETSLFEELIDSDQVALCGLVEAEIRYGLRFSERDQVLGLLRGFHRLATTEADLLAGGTVGNRLRSSGVTVPLADCIIAATAIRTQVMLLSSDIHHRRIPKLSLLSSD